MNESQAESGDGATVSENLTVEGIAAVLDDASPEPNQAAIDAHNARETERAAQWADLRDGHGRAFDKDLHVTDTDGSPKLTSGGKLRLRPGRKKGSSGNNGAVSTGYVGARPAGSVSQDSINLKQQARANGQAAASTFILLGVAFGGDEWKPRISVSEGINEQEYLAGAFAAYFEAKNMRDLPPGVALSVAMLAYAAPRFAMPKTQTKLQLFTTWLRGKLKRNKKATDDGAQSHIGDDGKRKNDTSEKTRKHS